MLWRFFAKNALEMPLIISNDTGLRCSVNPFEGKDNAHVAQAEIEFDTPGT